MKSPRQGGVDKRVPVQALFPSRQGPELYALSAHLLARCPGRDTYRMVQVFMGAGHECCSEVAMT